MDYINPFLLLKPSTEVTTSPAPASMVAGAAPAKAGVGGLGGMAAATSDSTIFQGSQLKSLLQQSCRPALGGVVPQSPPLARPSLSQPQRVPDKAPAAAPVTRTSWGDILRIESMGPTPARSRKIAECYQQLSQDLGEMLGTSGSNWAAYASWGARQVAEHAPSSAAPGGPQARRALFDGNLAVFSETAPALQAFVESFRRDIHKDPAKLARFLERPELQGRPEVKSAVLLLHQAHFTSDAEEKRQLTLQADRLLAVYERDKLSLDIENVPGASSFLTETLFDFALPQGVIEPEQAPSLNESRVELDRLKDFFSHLESDPRRFYLPV